MGITNRSESRTAMLRFIKRVAVKGSDPKGDVRITSRAGSTSHH